VGARDLGMMSRAAQPNQFRDLLTTRSLGLTVTWTVPGGLHAS
jgi:hypothetical protein